MVTVLAVCWRRPPEIEVLIVVDKTHLQPSFAIVLRTRGRNL